MTPEELEQWFNEDESVSTEAVNEGELEFLLEPPVKPVLHSINSLTITEDSIDSGWVLLEQCYKNLDPIAKADVAFRYTSMRGLTITAHQNIDQLGIRGQSVQLTNIKPDAELCIRAEVRILSNNHNGTFSLNNGPFHRKFLDGFYPFHITLNIDYPASLLKSIQISPQQQAGFNISRSAGSILIDSYFAGMLSIEIIFQSHQL